MVLLYMTSFGLPIQTEQFREDEAICKQLEDSVSVILEEKEEMAMVGLRYIRGSCYNLSFSYVIVCQPICILIFI